MATTLAYLRLRLRELTDTENDSHLSDSELNRYLNSAGAEVYDLLVLHAPSDYYLKEWSFSTVAGQSEYALPSDFYKLRALYVSDGGVSSWRPIGKFSEDQFISAGPPSSAVPLKALYIPKYTELVDDTDELDGVNGWEELVLQIAAIDVKTKREEDISPYARKRGQLEDRVRRMSARDAGEPERILDRRPRGSQGWKHGISSTIHGYRIRAGNLVIFQRIVGFWL